MALRFPTGKNEEIPQRNKETVYDNTNEIQEEYKTPLEEMFPQGLENVFKSFFVGMAFRSFALSLITSLFYLGGGVTSSLVNNCSPFYLSFIHFALKLVFAPRNVRCFLRLVKNDFS